jgi:transcriptional regulator with XRE-family HTH domain
MHEGKPITKLGQILAEARSQKGLSAREVAEAIGAHHTTITMLERAQIEQPRPDKLTKLARVLELDAIDLLTLAGYNPADKLPTFGVYLRSTTPLPEQAIGELEGYYHYLHDKYGAESAGPAPGEDEA